MFSIMFQMSVVVVRDLDIIYDGYETPDIVLHRWDIRWNFARVSVFALRDLDLGLFVRLKSNCECFQ